MKVSPSHAASLKKSAQSSTSDHAPPQVVSASFAAQSAAQSLPPQPSVFAAQHQPSHISIESSWMHSATYITDDAHGAGTWRSPSTQAASPVTLHIAMLSQL